MERYLVFDAGCNTCNSLGSTIADIAKDKLRPINIHDAEAETLLRQIYPDGWPHAPYLIVDDNGQLKAWTGLQMTLRLGWLFGPRRAWTLWRSTQQTGVSLPLTVGIVTGVVSRRGVLKLSFGAAMAAMLHKFSLQSAYACVPCETCGTSCRKVQSCAYYVICQRNNRMPCDRYNCYDQRTGEICDQYELCGPCCGCRCA